MQPAKVPDGTGVLVAFGDVNYDSEGVEPDSSNLLARSRAVAPIRFERLLQTHFEVETLGELCELLRGEEAVLFTRDDATVEALIENASQARYLHIATHGWFALPEFKSTLDFSNDELTSFSRAEDTVRGFAPESLCGLAFSGANLNRSEGIITAEELSTLDLSNCELAVLSACETNVGIRRAGQGIQSLQTALHAAGARTAITSLWNEKLGKSDALWQAKMATGRSGTEPGLFRRTSATVAFGDSGRSPAKQTGLGTGPTRKARLHAGLFSLTSRCIAPPVTYAASELLSRSRRKPNWPILR